MILYESMKENVESIFFVLFKATPCNFPGLDPLKVHPLKVQSATVLSEWCQIMCQIVKDISKSWYLGKEMQPEVYTVWRATDLL